MFREQRIIQNQAITDTPPAGGGAPPSIVDPPSGAPPASGGAPNSATPPSAGDSWLSSLPEDIRTDPSLQVFKDPASLAKSWVNAQKMIGTKAVQIPGDNATPEEFAAFYAKVGRPEAAEKYEIKLPEGKKLDDNFSKGFKEAAWNSGLSGKQAQKLVDWYEGFVDSHRKNAEAQGQLQFKETLENYKKELGGEDKFMARLEDARLAVRALGNDKLRGFLDETGLGSRPEMIDFFADLRKMMSEDKLRDGTGIPLKVEDASTIQAEIAAIESQLFSMDPSNTNRSALIEQRSRLYERMSAIKKSSQA